MSVAGVQVTSLCSLWLAPATPVLAAAAGKHHVALSSRRCSKQQRTTHSSCSAQVDNVLTTRHIAALLHGFHQILWGWRFPALHGFLLQPSFSLAWNTGTYSGSSNTGLVSPGSDFQLDSLSGTATTVIDCQGAGQALALSAAQTPATLIAGQRCCGSKRSANPALLIRKGNSTHIADRSYWRLLYTGVTFQNCAANNGGALSITGGSPQLQRLMFSSNIAHVSSVSVC